MGGWKIVFSHCVISVFLTNFHLFNPKSIGSSFGTLIRKKYFLSTHTHRSHSATLQNKWQKPHGLLCPLTGKIELLFPLQWGGSQWGPGVLTEHISPRPSPRSVINGKGDTSRNTDSAQCELDKWPVKEGGFKAKYVFKDELKWENDENSKERH